MGLFDVLLTWVPAIVGRILMALGFTVMSVVGLDVAIDQLKAQLQQAAGALGTDAFSLFLIAGGGSAIGIVLGAINLRLALWLGTRSARIVGLPQGGS
jgi:cell division protein FtsX